MTLEELQSSVNGLEQTSIGIKAELLDIKEVLADYDDSIKDVNKKIEDAQIKIQLQLTTKLNSFITSDDVSKSYYDKTDIDSKFDSFNSLDISDIEDYLSSNEYVKSNDIKTLVSRNYLNEYLDNYTQEFLTSENADKTYVTKTELSEFGNSVMIDLSPYVTYGYLNNNYYTSEQIDKLIPSTVGFVKKSELYSLLSLDDFAYTEWVEKNFLKRGEISLTGYVTESMLSKALEDYDNVVYANDLNETLKKYAKIDDLTESLRDLGSNITEVYVPALLSSYKRENELVTKQDIKTFVTRDEIRDVLNSVTDASDIDLSEYVLRTELGDYVVESTFNDKLSTLMADITGNYIPNVLDTFKSKLGYVSEDYASHVFATKDEIRNILENTLTLSDIPLNEYVRNDEISKYVTIDLMNMYVDDVFSSVMSDFVPNALSVFKVKNELVSESYVNHTFATKEELRNYIEISHIDTTDFVKSDDMTRYATLSYVDANVDKVIFDVKNKYISEALDEFAETCGFASNDYVNHTFATKEEFRNYIIRDNNQSLEDYVKNETLEDYVMSSELNYQMSNMLADILGKHIPNALDTLKSNLDYASNDYVNHTFATKEEFRKYIMENGTVESKEYILDDYVKNDELDGYVTTVDFSKAISNMEGTIIPNALDSFKVRNELVSQPYVNKTFVTKDEFRNYMSTLSVDDDKHYVVNDDLKDYVLMSSLDERIFNLKSDVVEKYIPNALSIFEENLDYVTPSYVNHTFATKEELRNHILSGDGSSFDENVLKEYVDKSLEDYVTMGVLYEKINLISANINGEVIPNSLTTFKTKNELVSQPYVDKTFVTKDEFRNYLLNVDNEAAAIEMLNDYAKVEDFNDYVTITAFENVITDVVDTITKEYIPDTLSSYVTSSYATHTFATKEELRNHIINGDNNIIDESLLGAYAKLEDLDNYMLTSDYDNKISDLIAELTGNYIPNAFDRFKANSGFATEDYVKHVFATKEELRNFVLSGGVDATFDEDLLKDYVKTETIDELYATKESLNNIIADIEGVFIPNALDVFKVKNELVSQPYVDKTFATKEELRNFILSGGTDATFDEDLLKDYVKSDSLYKYLTLDTFDNEIVKLRSDIENNVIPNVVESFGYATENYVNHTFATKEEFRNYILNGGVLGTDESILEDYIKKEDLGKYTTVVEHNNDIFNLISNIKDKYIPEALVDFAQKSGYATENYVNHTFATKEEFRNYILNGDETDSSILEGYVKTEDLDKYVSTKTFNDEVNTIIANLTGTYIPSVLTSFKTKNELVSQTYVDKNFVTKEDLVKYVVESDNNTSIDINFDDYAKKTDLEAYMLKSDMSNYVDYGVYGEHVITTNTNISNINKSLKKYAQLSQLSDYVRTDVLKDYLDDYVTKEHLLDELNKLSEEDSDYIFNLDTSKFLTVDDYDKLTQYIDETTDGYLTLKDVFNKDYIKNHYMTINDIEENIYTKKQSDDKFITKDEGEDVFLKVSTAYSNFLSKEDYRGIKAAMTLSSAYKNSPEIFEYLLENGKLYDGFYMLGEAVVIVKDNKKWCIELAGTTSYTKEDIDAMDLSSKEWVENYVTEYLENEYKPKWTICRGGDY